ncbi:MAG TPA: hypothetical protein VMV49_03920 [Candidatus Deferrimicrobium sp.]|nr:hypothetical protein [Candidatus Deferrimicrobium sp.]
MGRMSNKAIRVSFLILILSMLIPLIYTTGYQKRPSEVYEKFGDNAILMEDSSPIGWWNTSYLYRSRLIIQNLQSSAIPEGYSMRLSLDTANLVAAEKLRADGDDFRIVWYDASAAEWLEIDRINETNFNSKNTEVWFRTQRAISPTTNDSNYYLYYCCKNAAEPPANKRNVYNMYNDFTQNNGAAIGWDVIKGTGWRVINNEYRENELLEDRITVLTNYNVKNAIIEVRVKNDGTDFGLGVLWRYKNKNNYYAATLGLNGWDIVAAKRYAAKNSIIEHTGHPESELVPNAWYTLIVYALGSQILIYLNNILKISVTDADLPDGGQIGFTTWNVNNESYFDDLKVRLLVEIPPNIVIEAAETYLPQYSNLIESANPLELGDNETITIDVIDLAGVEAVLIEYDGVNQSMVNIGGIQYQYTSWIPTKAGLHPYTIYMKNINNRWNSASGCITVQDTKLPIYSDLIESADPLEIGIPINFTIKVADLAGINQVLIEYENSNHSMTKIRDTEWKYDIWIPESPIVYNYAIYMKDNNGNWNKTPTNTLTVIDTVPPKYSNLIERSDPIQLGNNEYISIKVTDLPGSGVDKVLLEYNDVASPVNHSMIKNGIIWEWANWKPVSMGIHHYSIYMVDNKNNWNKTSGDITVIESFAPTLEKLEESGDPTELGNSITINIYAYDEDANVSIVLLEYEGNNYTMYPIGGDRYEILLTPISVGQRTYKIYANDSHDNWNKIVSTFDVIDTTPPTYHGLWEQADPVELGIPVYITINTTDLTSINQVLIQYESKNTSMSYVGQNQWQHTWIPLHTGLHEYTIYMEDTNHNWNFTSNSITVQDTHAPTFSILTTPEEPMELGNPIAIGISTSDLAGINQVCIEYDNTNHSMGEIDDNIWQYEAWIPIHIGAYPYIIYIQDKNDNWNSTSNIVSVVDTIPPSFSNLYESSNPLELGSPLTIRIEATDLAGIPQVLLEYENNNHSMTNINGKIWQYTWMPNTLKVFEYAIYIEDNSQNWNSLKNNSLTVQDTTPPPPPIISLAPVGEVSGILAFSWWEGSDPSGIAYYRLIIDTEENPFATPGSVLDVTINSTFFELDKELTADKYYFFLYQIDAVNQTSSVTRGSFTVIEKNTNHLLFLIPIGLAIAGGGLGTVVVLSKRKSHDITLKRKRILLKVILSHINQISKSQSSTKNELNFQEKPEEAVDQTFDTGDLESQIKEIQALGEEMLVEGAYLEVVNHFNQAAETFLRYGYQAESQIFSKKAEELKYLIDKRDEKLEIIEYEKSKNNLSGILNLYNEIIEISRKLNDVVGVELYQEELNQLQDRPIDIGKGAEVVTEETVINQETSETPTQIQDTECPLGQAFNIYKELQIYAVQDLKSKRDNLEKRAISMEQKGLLASASRFYEKCEEISVQLVQLGNLEEKENEEEYKNKKTRCMELRIKKSGGDKQV